MYNQSLRSLQARVASFISVTAAVLVLSGTSAFGQIEPELVSVQSFRLNKNQLVITPNLPLGGSEPIAILSRNLYDAIRQSSIRLRDGRILITGTPVQIDKLFADTNFNYGQSRVVGPKVEKANDTDIPWQAALILKSNFFTPLYSQLCGASIISADWIVTAAHCFNSIDRKDWASAIYIAYGGADLENLPNKSEIERVEIPKDFNHVESRSKATGQSYRNDIALIKLKTPIRFDKTSKPIRYVNSSEASRLVRHSMPLRVSGWGHVYAEASGNEPKWDQVIRSQNLLFVTVNAISKEKCEESGVIGQNVSDHFVCALGIDGGDACTNDSGGPLVSSHHTDRVPTLVGIVSFGFGCGQRGTPGMYTNVARHFAWIQETISKSN